MPEKQMQTKDDNNGWREWSRYVLKELERLNVCYNELDHKMSTLLKEVTILKVKSGMWGMIGGAVPVMVMLAIWLLKIK